MSSIQIGDGNELVSIVVSDENGIPVDYGVNPLYMNIVRAFHHQNVFDFNIPRQMMIIILSLVHEKHMQINDDSMMIKLMHYSARLGIREIFVNFGYMMLDTLYVISSESYLLFMTHCLSYTRDCISYTIANEEEMDEIMVRVTRKAVYTSVDMRNMPHSMALFVTSIAVDEMKNRDEIDTHLICPDMENNHHNHLCNTENGKHYPSNSSSNCPDHIWKCRDGKMIMIILEGSCMNTKKRKLNQF